MFVNLDGQFTRAPRAVQAVALSSIGVALEVTPPSPTSPDEDTAAFVALHRQRFYVVAMPPQEPDTTLGLSRAAAAAYMMLGEAAEAMYLRHEEQAVIEDVSKAIWLWARDHDLSADRVAAMIITGLARDLAEYGRIMSYSEETVGRWLRETSFTLLGQQVIAVSLNVYRRKKGWFGRGRSG